MPGCSTVSHVNGGLSSTGMEDGLLRILVWTSLPLSGISADGTEFGAMVIVFSSFVSCGCEFSNGNFVCRTRIRCYVLFLSDHRSCVMGSRRIPIFRLFRVISRFF